MIDASNKSNPKIEKKHRNESWWQISFPVLLSVFFVITIIILLIIGEKFSEAGVFADYLSIWIIAGVVLSGAPLLILIIFISGGIQRGTGSIPEFTFKGQSKLVDMKKKVDDFTDNLAGKIIKARSMSAGLKKVTETKVSTGEVKGTGETS